LERETGFEPATDGKAVAIAEEEAKAAGDIGFPCKQAVQGQQ
jgi:hypothetical protein